MIKTDDLIFKKTLDLSISRMFSQVDSLRNLDNCYVSLQFRKVVLNEHLDFELFLLIIIYIIEISQKYSKEISDYLKLLNFLREEKEVGVKFYKHLNLIKFLIERELPNNLTAKKYMQAIDNILHGNQIGTIVFITPEIGRWSTVGGLGVMVDELSQGLVTLGREVIVISPYYDKNRKGEIEYLKRDPAKFEYIKNVEIDLDLHYSFGIHYGEVNGVKLYFLHNFTIFPFPYPDVLADFAVKQIACFCKASLELICSEKIVPDIILTNDWFTGMAAAYSKHGHFGSYFKNSKFFHICHNLEPSYEGRLYPDQGQTFEHVYKLPAYQLIDPWWGKTVINPSRCALMNSDQWGTVSKSYQKELQDSSPLNFLLNSFPRPFSYPNGIFRKRRLEALRSKVTMSKIDAKREIQKKYFGYNDLDDSIPVFAFVGRITEQKGVALICHTAEMIITKMNGKVNIIVGGMGNMKDPYVGHCAYMMSELRKKYPYAFWADPNEFFTDGPLINVGANFGLMPSVFEPGGIVQHEFFIASTPVLAFKTGGLKDTVIEYNYDSRAGNGINFESHSEFDLLWAFERAVKLFKNREHYEIAQRNAFDSAIDVLDVARAWDNEFHRLKNKIYYDSQALNSVDYEKEYNQLADKQVLRGHLLNFELEKFDFTKDYLNKNIDIGTHSDEKVITFVYFQEGIVKPTTVSIVGSFTGWKNPIPLVFDPIFEKWSVKMTLHAGEYYFKFIVDGEWHVSSNNKIVYDVEGNSNNYIYI